MQNPDKATPSLAPSTRNPIGFKRGMEELAALLTASEPTNTQHIVKVIIVVPESLPPHFRDREAGNTAIREFFLIADPESEIFTSRDKLLPVPDLSNPRGVRANLFNGGAIVLKLRQENNNGQQIVIGELKIENHQILGFETIEQIDFLVSELGTFLTE